MRPCTSHLPRCFQAGSPHAISRLVVPFIQEFVLLISGITAILKKIGCQEQNCDGTTVAIGGSMFEEHHLLEDRVKHMVHQLMGKDCKIELKLQKGP